MRRERENRMLRREELELEREEEQPYAQVIQDQASLYEVYPSRRDLIQGSDRNEIEDGEILELESEQNEEAVDLHLQLQREFEEGRRLHPFTTEMAQMQLDFCRRAAELQANNSSLASSVARLEECVRRQTHLD